MKRDLFLLRCVEVLGTLVLLLIIIAVGRSYGLLQAPGGLGVLQWILFGMTVILFVNSFAKIIGFHNPKRNLALGTLLIVVALITFWGIPEFFYHALGRGINSYWLLVSYYSLPAVMIEGGIFAIFNAVFFGFGTAALSSRERTLLILFFMAYATVAVGVNFLVIKGSMSIEHQLWFSRGISSLVLIVTLALAYRTLK